MFNQTELERFLARMKADRVRAGQPPRTTDPEVLDKIAVLIQAGERTKQQEE